MTDLKENFEVWEGQIQQYQNGQPIWVFNSVIRDNLTLEQAKEVLTQGDKLCKIVEKQGEGQYVLVSR